MRRKVNRTEQKVHCYTLRKNLFKIIENVNVCHQARLDDFYVMSDFDIVYNYPNYFKASNIS